MNKYIVLAFLIASTYGAVTLTVCDKCVDYKVQALCETFGCTWAAAVAPALVGTCTGTSTFGDYFNANMTGKTACAGRTEGKCVGFDTTAKSMCYWDTTPTAACKSIAYNSACDKGTNEDICDALVGCGWDSAAATPVCVALTCAALKDQPNCETNHIKADGSLLFCKWAVATGCSDAVIADLSTPELCDKAIGISGYWDAAAATPVCKLCTGSVVEAAAAGGDDDANGYLVGSMVVLAMALIQ